MRIRNALKYECRKKDDDLTKFLTQLPEKLKNDLAYVIHKNNVSKFPFFKDKSKSFIAHVAQLLRPIKLVKGSYIYEEAEPIDYIYFINEGSVAFVVKEVLSNATSLNPNNRLEKPSQFQKKMERKKSRKNMKGNDTPFLVFREGHYFGELEVLLLENSHNGNGTSRKFTAKAQNDVELFAITIKDLLNLPYEYKKIMADLFKNSQKKMSKIQELKKKAQESIALKKDVALKKVSTKHWYESNPARQKTDALEKFTELVSQGTILVERLTEFQSIVKNKIQDDEESPTKRPRKPSNFIETSQKCSSIDSKLETGIASMKKINHLNTSIHTESFSLDNQEESKSFDQSEKEKSIFEPIHLIIEDEDDIAEEVHSEVSLYNRQSLHSRKFSKSELFGLFDKSIKKN